eukprot:g3644.t1
MEEEEGERSYGDEAFELPPAVASEEEHNSYASDEFEAPLSPEQRQRRRSVEILMELERHLEEELKLERELTKIHMRNVKGRQKDDFSIGSRGRVSTSRRPQSRLALTYQSVLDAPDLLPDASTADREGGNKVPFDTCTLGKGTVHSLHKKVAPAHSFSRVVRGSSGDTRLLFFSNLDKKGRSWSARNERAKQLKNATRREGVPKSE